MWGQKYEFASLFIRCHRRCHSVFVRIRFVYVDMLGRLYAAVEPDEFNRLRIMHECLIGLRSGRTTQYHRVRLWLPRTEPKITTSWSRSPLRHLGYSGDNVKTLDTLSRCCLCRCGCIIIWVQFNDCQYHQIGCAVLRISFPEVVSCVPPSRLCEFVKLHLLLPKPLNALLYRFGDCAHHPAGLIIFAQLALLCLFIILIFPILPMVRTSNMTQTVSSSNYHLLKSLFGISVRQSRISRFPCFFLQLPNRCVCLFNLLSCPSSFSHNIILDRFFFPLIA